MTRQQLAALLQRAPCVSSPLLLQMIEMALHAAGIRERCIAEFVWVIFVLAKSISGVDDLVDYVAVFARDGSLGAQTNCIHDLLWPDGDRGRGGEGVLEKTRKSNERNTMIHKRKQTRAKECTGGGVRAASRKIRRGEVGRDGGEQSEVIDMHQTQTNARAIIAG
jgi:hypothetical protein